MSADKHNPLFISDDDDDINEVIINVMRAREQLAVAEKLQQEHIEQRRPEREQHWAEAEAERLR